MTISKLKYYCYDKLKQASIKRPDFESELLLAYILKKDRSYIISHPETKISIFDTIKAAYLCQKRINDTPLAYLLKEKHFYNLCLYINKRVLVPRPESELFIDYFKDLNYTNTLTIDLGTGSGALIISLVKNLKLESFNNYKFVASDISKKALSVAKINAKKQNISENIEFLHSNLLSKLNTKLLDKYKNIYILANLPYLNSQEIKEKSIRKEPILALYSQNNGLHHYFKLLIDIKHRLPSDKHLIIAMEINPQQKDKLIQEINYNFSKADINIIKDYNNKDRLLIVKIK